MIDILLFFFLVYAFFIFFFFIHSFTTDHSIFYNDQKHKTIHSAIMISRFYKINNIFQIRLIDHVERSRIEMAYN